MSTVSTDSMILFLCLLCLVASKTFTITHRQFTVRQEHHVTFSSQQLDS